MAHIFSYVNHETFTSQVSLLALTMVILGGLGNVAGAILGAVVLVEPARTVPRGRRIPHADLRHRAAAADPLPPAGPDGDGVMAPASCEIEGLTRRFGGVTAVDRAGARPSNEGELVSIIGPNGAGKTTRVQSGHRAGHAGRRQRDVRRPRRSPACRPNSSRRSASPARSSTAACSAISACSTTCWSARTRGLRAVRPQWPVVGPVAELALALVRPGSVRPRKSGAARGRAGDPRAVRRAAAAAHRQSGLLALLRQPPPRWRSPARWRSRPRVLFLDEPTAGMNPTETAEMLEIIRDLKGRA